MKNNVLLVLVLPCILFSFLNCINPVNDKRRNDKVYLFDPGAENYAMNMSLSGISWGTGHCGETKNIIPVHDGDLLHILLSNAGTFSLLFEYDESDGTYGQFGYETVNEYTYLYKMNNSAIQLNLSGISNAWQWLASAQSDDLKTIRSLCFTGNIDSSPYDLLQKVAQVNSSPGIYFENSGQLLKVLPMFKPVCMILGKWDISSFEEEQAYTLLKNQKNLKKVYFTSGGDDPVQNYKFLSSLPALQSIMIFPSLFNQITAASLPENLAKLEELIVFSGNTREIKDLSIVRNLLNIKKIRFIMTEISCNIDDLYSIPGLTTLCFTGTNIVNVPPVKEMPGLKWFSFPVNTDQAYFQAFLGKNPRIEYLEITGCKNITDLSPLHYLKNLKGLILVDMEIEDYSPLYSMKDTDFLILPSELFKENNGTEIEELKKGLPDSAIVCGEPFCLGSGWILLIPLVILLCLVFIIGFKKIQIHTRKRC